MQDALPRPPSITDVTDDAERAAQTIATPELPSSILALGLARLPQK